jgi:cytoskeletal protein CcmA (bactofilin family)
LFRKEIRPRGDLPPTLTDERPEENPMPMARKENTVSLKTEDITTILGKGSEFEGKLHFEGTLRIEGVYSGEIHSDSVLVVGEGAKVSAEVNIGTIVINGEVKGNVRATQGVEIRGGGKMFGNLETPALVIEKGVIFEGNCKMVSLSPKGSPFVATDAKKVERPELPKK